MILGRVFNYCLTAVTAALIAMTTAATAAADDQVYRHSDEFVSGAFDGTPPAARALWVQPALREKLSREFGWQAGLRVRFWQDGNRTAWILDEIGKERPITAGVVVEDGAIDRVEVLVFRESRGWEIKFPFFTDQFTALTLSDRGALSHSIDGITGATLSVRAMKRMARVALKLHDETQQTTLARRP
jgi:hypothetical protein